MNLSNHRTEDLPLLFSGLESIKKIWIRWHPYRQHGSLWVDLCRSQVGDEPPIFEVDWHYANGKRGRKSFKDEQEAMQFFLEKTGKVKPAKKSANRE